MKAYIIKFRGETICAVQNLQGISNKMRKAGYTAEEAEIEPIPTTEIAVDHGHGWEPAKRYAIYNGQTIEYRYFLI